MAAPLSTNQHKINMERCVLCSPLRLMIQVHEMQVRRPLQAVLEHRVLAHATRGTRTQAKMGPQTVFLVWPQGS